MTTRTHSPHTLTSFCTFSHKFLFRLAVVSLFFLTAKSTFAKSPIDGYTNFAAMEKQISDLEKSKLVRVKSLGTTLGKRKLYLLTIGKGEVDKKPAILVVGNVHAPHLLGSELAMRIAKSLGSATDDNKKIQSLLDKYTFYIIPRPSPDASEAFFGTVLLERTGNHRNTDDDRDGKLSEDGPDDLNDDKVITMMRVLDNKGPYRLHPDDPRVLIKASAAKNETGGYSLYSEGKDNDGDERFNEDAPGGVSFNRNFTFRYPFFKSGAGPNQVSEIETRAVADFAFSHPNIALVFTFTPEDNLMNPWKPNSTLERRRIKTTLLAKDAPYTKYLAGKFRKIHGGKNSPASPNGAGSFSQWAYFHYGRWSLASRGWWIPKVPASKPKKGEKKPSGEKRGSDDINTLRWLAKEKLDGFVAWKKIDHPDFPKMKVEVGGFKPFVRLNPPAKYLDDLGKKHTSYIVQLCSLLPKVNIPEVKVEPLGENIYRVTATVQNIGYLPTMSEMGRISKHVYPLQLAVTLPKEVSLINGHPRTRLNPLNGKGSRTQYQWLMRKTGKDAIKLKLKVYCPSVLGDETTLELK